MAHRLYHERKTEGGIVRGKTAMGQLFGVSARTISRWIAEEGFPAARLPQGDLCTSLTLLDLWLMRRLQNPVPHRIQAKASKARAGKTRVGGGVHASTKPQGR